MGSLLISNEASLYKDFQSQRDIQARDNLVSVSKSGPLS